ncbi:MAG TPA: RNA 2',3'-cyclic phosphodiesterase [Candidatus Limnocylindria bacterium]|nr:RNA 2',3'-cyclic phosphodiesterase [Candidatus Limnocylindria bacterium]
MSDSARPERWRLFVAAPLPAAAAQALWAALDALRRAHPDARWTRPEQLHLTLVFLGATEPARVPDIQAAVGATAASQAPFAVSTGEPDGRLDDRRGGVAWLRLSEGRREIARLSRRLDRAIGSGVYARSAPRPHVTVARGVDARLLADLAGAGPDLRFGWRVERAVLYRSFTGPAGSTYEALADAPLGFGLERER